MLCHDYGVNIGISTICQFLHRSVFSHQRMVLIAKQRYEYLRATFAIDVSCYKPEMLVFLDETGADRRNTVQKYSYSLRGKPAKSHKLLIWRKRVSAIAVMSIQGLLDCKIVHELVDGDVFYDFVHTQYHTYNSLMAVTYIAWSYLTMLQYIMWKKQLEQLRTWVLLFTSYPLTHLT